MTERHHSSRIFSLLIVLFLLSWSGSQLDTLREKFQAIRSSGAGTEPVIVKVYYLDQDDQANLVARFDVIEVNESGGYLLIRLEPAEREELESSGYHVEIHDGDI